MKIRFSAFFAFALFAAVACEGPTGPAGPQGPEGSIGQGVQVSRWVGTGVLNEGGTAYVQLPENSGSLVDPPLISCFMDRGDGNLWVVGMVMGGPHCFLQKNGSGLEVVIDNAVEWHGKKAYVSMMMVE